MKRIDHKHDNRKGDLAEYYAVTWLWDNGYEVFKNCGCSGPVDLVAFKDGEFTLIDVKTKTGTSGRTRNQTQKELGVKLLNYNSETRKLNFVRHKNDTKKNI